MQTVAVTFAAGLPSLLESQRRLNDQLSKDVDRVLAFTDASPQIAEFVTSNPNIFCHKRGFGCWAWKPFVILEALKEVEDEDVVIYADSGSSLSSSTKPLVDLCVSNGGTLLFENRNGNAQGGRWLNKDWTKADCFNKMGCSGAKFYEAPQVDAAFQLYQKNKFNLSFVEEYLKYCLDPHIITDLPNVTAAESPYFRDHRHDQSVLSLLAAKYEIKLFPEPSKWGRPVDHIRKKLGYGPIFDHHRGRR